MKKEQQFICVAAKFGFDKGNQGWQSTCTLQEQERRYYLFKRRWINSFVVMGPQQPIVMSISCSRRNEIVCVE